ncbi:hypothetical protein V9N50_001856 [Vibrio cholerae]
MKINTEIVLLKAIYEHIDEMVNNSMFTIQGKHPAQMVMFKTSIHRRLFYILLVDFLSATDEKGPLGKRIFLRGLADICDKPNFSVNGSHCYLKARVQDFINWLNETKETYIWMPSIDREVDLKITRIEMIKMAGDISKHNYLRSIGVARKLKEILEKSGVEIDDESALYALDDFYERFNDDVLIYLSSHVCEFLNDIRLGIYEYLKPEFMRSYIFNGEDSIPIYDYLIPDSLSEKYSRVCYWAVMNNIRRKPYLPKFTVSDSFKTEY